MYIYKQKSPILILFLVFMCTFAVSHYAEIYPSLIFPSFSNAPVMKANAIIPATEVYGIKQDGTKIILNKDSLFYNLYNKHNSYMLKTIAKKYNAASAKGNNKNLIQLKNYLTAQLKQINASYFRSILIEEQDVIYHLKSNKIYQIKVKKSTNILLQ